MFQAPGTQNQIVVFRSNTLQEIQIELSVGETLRIGDYTVTLLEIDGDELVVELDSDGDWGDSPELDELRESLQFS